MLVPLSWLKELVQIDVSTDDLAEKLSIAGFEVEDIRDRSENIHGVIVGFITSFEKHPNADKLKICEVDVGSSKNLQIICGANNVRQGIHVPVAVEGCILGAINLKIKKSKLRGVESEGMICSMSELGLETDSAGI